MKRLKYLAMAALVAFAACDEGEDIVVIQPVTGTVSGTVSAEGAGVAGVTVTLAGPTSQTATTGANGSYTFSNVEEGAYAVSISGVPAGFVFSSTTKTAVISQDGQTVTVDFAGNIVRSASISGQVTASGVGVGGVAVQISGPEGTETKQTGASGNFSFTGLRDGNYTITITNPDATKYTFAVTSQQVALSAGEAEVVNFAGTANQPATITGSVLASGQPVPGATITVSQGGTTVKTTTTNVSGSYQVNVDPGTYTVTLSGFDAARYSFTTTSRTVEVTAGETEDVSFGGTAQGGTGEAASVVIERIVAAGTLAPIGNNALTGAMVIQVGIDEGDQEVAKLDVLVNNTVVCTQTFSTPVSGLAAVGETFDVDCTWNSAALNATNDPLFTNGAVTIKAEITTASGATRTATVSGQLMNADFILTTISAPDQAAGVDGLLWNDGDVTVTAEPVRYSGGSAVNSMTVSLHAGTGASPVVATLPATDADGDGIFTVTFSEAPITGPDLAAVATSDLSASISTIQVDNQLGPTFGVPGAINAAGGGVTIGTNPFRYDNLAPVFQLFNAAGAATAGAAGNLPAGRWVNGTFTFGGVVGSDFAGPDNNLSTAADNTVGANIVTVSFQAGTSASTLQPVTTGSDLQESLTNNSYIVLATICDVLDNCRSTYIDGTGLGSGTNAAAAAAATKIGVDVVAPVIQSNAGTLTAQEPILPGNSLISLVLAADNRSGYSGTPIQLYVNRYTPTATTCVVDGSAATGCQPASFDTTFDYFVDPVTGFPTAGYYRATYWAVDMAANASAQTTQTNVYDVTAPTVGGIGFDAQLTAGQNETFNAPVSDNLDLDGGAFYLQYGAGPWLELQETDLGAFGPEDGFNVQGFFSPTVDFVASVENTLGGAIMMASNARADVVDFGNNLTSGVTAIPAANVVGAATTSFNAAARGPSGQVTAATTTISNATVCIDADNDGCTNPTSTTVTLRIDGATGQLLNLFPEVYFYVEKNNVGSNLWERVGSASVAITDNGVIRRYAYSTQLSVSAFADAFNSALAPEAHTIGILAIAADGTALWVTQGVTVNVD